MIDYNKLLAYEIGVEFIGNKLTFVVSYLTKCMFAGRVASIEERLRVSKG